MSCLAKAIVSWTVEFLMGGRLLVLLENKKEMLNPRRQKTVINLCFVPYAHLYARVCGHLLILIFLVVSTPPPPQLALTVFGDSIIILLLLFLLYREAWRAVVHGVANSQTRLSDWAELNWLTVLWFSFLMLFLFPGWRSLLYWGYHLSCLSKRWI